MADEEKPKRLWSVCDHSIGHCVIPEHPEFFQGAKLLAYLWREQRVRESVKR